MWLKCDYCGKEYKTYISPRCKYHYCSKNCTNKAHNTKIKLNCEWCNKEIYKRPKEIVDDKHYFCSKECLNNWQGRNKIKFICKVCGKEFYRSSSWIKQKKGYYCSLSCRSQDEKWKEKIINANQTQCKKKGLNKLELKGNEILNKLNLEYYTQYLINGKICVDVYIPKYNLIIQWDGDYWHGKDKCYEKLEKRIKQRVDLDKSQDAYLKKCGFNELRFWESDVLKKEDFVYENIEKTIRQITK